MQTPKTHALSPVGLAIIKSHESCQLQAYLCPANRVTIGYGHVILPKHDGWLFPYVKTDVLSRLVADCQTRKAFTHEAKVVLKISSIQADELLKKDVRQTELFINSVAQYNLNQNQFDALVSLIFNIGQGNFAISTLRKKLYAGDFVGAAAEFDRWIYATRNGKKFELPGLVTRRAVERALFETPVEMPS